MLILLILFAAVLLEAQPFASGPRVHAPATGQTVDARVVLEDADGFVWVSGPSGTFRYDGLRYQPGTLFGLPAAEATQFELTRSGTVWVWIENQLWWRDANEARFTPLDLGEAVEGMAAVGDQLYVLRPRGMLSVLTRQRGDARNANLPGDSRVVRQSADETWWITHSPISVRQRQLQGDPDGKLWYGTFSSFSWTRWNGHEWENGTVPLTPPTDQLWQVMPIGDQDFFSSDGHSIIRYHRDGPAGPAPAARVGFVASESRVRQEHLFSSAYGTWVLMNGSCVRLLPQGQVEYFRYAGPHRIHALYPGKEVLWASAGTAGLLSFSRGRSIEWIQAYDSSEALAMAAVRIGERLIFVRADETYEIKPESREWDFGLKLSRKIAGAHWFGLPAASGPYEDTIVAPDGSLWQMLTKAGAVHLDARGKFLDSTAGHTAGRRFAPMHKMAFSGDGRLWVASTENLWEVMPVVPQSEYRAAGSWKGARYIADFVKDRTGAMWAVADGGLLRYASGTWREEALPGCVLDPRLRTVAFESADSVWFTYRVRDGFGRATRSGAGWTCEHFNAATGFEGTPQLLRFDRQGRLWRGDERGLWIARGRERSRPGDWLHLGAAEGLSTGEMSSIFTEEPEGSFLVGVGHMLQRIPAALLRPPAGAAPRLSTWEGQAGTLPIAGQLRVRQGEEGAVRLGMPAEPLPATLSIIEYRYSGAPGNAWERLEGSLLPLADAPLGESTVHVRFAGQPDFRSLSLLVEPVWWRGWPARGGFAALLALVLWKVRPAAVRLAFRYSRWRYQRAHPLVASPPAAPTGPPDWPPGTILRDCYRVDGLLARGGFSDVFAATDERSGEPLVIKRLRPLPETAERSASWLKKRFLQEVGVAGLLRHPGILPVLDTWFDDDGIPHIALPRVSGCNLRTYLTTRAPLPRGEVVHFLVCIAETVAAAHARGVIHCDLKPENIMIPEATDSEMVRPVVVDFGTSALHVQSAVLSEQTINGGSVRYMAPEQLLGRYSTASDVYALAIMALELVAQTRYGSLDLAIDRDWEANFSGQLRSLRFGERSTQLLVSALRWDPTQRPSNILQWTRDFVASLD